LYFFFPYIILPKPLWHPSVVFCSVALDYCRSVLLTRKASPFFDPIVPLSRLFFSLNPPCPLIFSFSFSGLFGRFLQPTPPFAKNSPCLTFFLSSPLLNASSLPFRSGLQGTARSHAAFNLVSLSGLFFSYSKRVLSHLFPSPLPPTPPKSPLQISGSV